MKRKMSLTEIQKLVFKEYKKNGYLESWTAYVYPHRAKSFQDKFDIAELALVSSEVSEATEIVRKPNELKNCITVIESKTGMYSDDLAFELADIIIRVLNFASRKKIDIESAILEKNRINLTRGKLHGKNV